MKPLPLFPILATALLLSGCSGLTASRIALFDGKTLAGWQGLVGNPLTRAQMSAEVAATAQAAANETMVAHWRVDDGALAFDGHGSHLCSETHYRNFILEVEWKISPGGDSGIYLRGSPQVQIWDSTQHPEGSGGLYNNQKGPSKPLLCADRPVGEWNHFLIRMVDERVWVDLNGERVVDGVALENYWDRKRPIFERGPIELQSHGSALWFRNVTIEILADDLSSDSRLDGT
ncbi:MAG TPA: DUF1080 domain-containing protein [Planctomycetes bacterium]|nr:DUF1080 domain-containing protein [Planctomycetota bacterium]